MQYLKIEQLSPAWWAYKVGKISGTRFGQVISTRENMLVEELANEILDGCCEMSDFESDDMKFGNENEPIAIDMYERHTGLKFERGGIIQSDYSAMHMASPDAVVVDKGIVVEVKCTMHGKTQLKRFRKGIETDKRGQIANYFACSDSIKEVHWISYCPFRPERPIVVFIFTRDSEFDKKTTFNDVVIAGRKAIPEIKMQVEDLISNFKQIEF